MVMKTLASSMLTSWFLLGAMSAVAGDLEEALAKTAYRIDPALATQADTSFARAIEIIGSQFAVGTHQEFRTVLYKAAILGHEGAADLLCATRSHEALGIAFFAEGYFWCRVAKVYFKDKDPAKYQAAKQHLEYVTQRLGSEHLYEGQEHEEFTLKRMRDAATPPAQKPADQS